MSTEGAMERIHVGFLCSFESQKKEIEEVADKQFKDLVVSCEIGILEEAIPAAKKLEKQGAEVLVAWEATAALLEKHLSIPVVSVPIRDMDILRALKMARRFGKQIGLIYNEAIPNLKELESLCDVKIHQISFTNMREFKYGIIDAFTKGCKVIIGKSYVTLDVASEYGRKAVLITFTTEMIINALRQAVNIALIRRRERETSARISVIFDSLTEGIIATDQSGKIVLINTTAAKMLGLTKSAALDKLITTIIPSERCTRAIADGLDIDFDIFDMEKLRIIGKYKPILSNGRRLGTIILLRLASEIQKADARIREEAMTRGFVARYTFDDFIGESPEIKAVIQRAKAFALTDSNLLIVGETGTGKEILAQSVHNYSRRKGKPFVAINCAAIPENLLESELFGHEEGAFTGARRRGKPGLFEFAHGGTVFLDEISSMPLLLQSRLLRVLEERKIMRIGGEKFIPIDVRVIAATNEDLRNCIKKGSFRQDLYFRLARLTLEIPPLRQRPTDIPLLVNSLLEKISVNYGRKKPRISKKVMNLLISYPWPGNVRELENVLERMVLLSGVTSIPDLLREMIGGDSDPCTDLVSSKDKLNESISLSLLNMSRSTLYRKMKRYKLIPRTIP